jgi:hypothetical protein
MFTTATQAAGESFSVIDNALYGQVLRGVSFAPSAVSNTGIPALPLWALASLTAAVLAVGAYCLNQKRSKITA